MPITYGPPDKKKDIKIEVPPGQMTLTTSPPEVTIYEATASATSEVTVQLAIKGLQPIFEKMDDLELYVMAHDDEPIGPRVNVKDVPDKAAKFIALYELQKREDEKKRRKTRLVQADGLADRHIRDPHWRNWRNYRHRQVDLPQVVKQGGGVQIACTLIF